MGSKGQNSFFSENGHGAYQIKEKNNMKAMTLSLHAPSTLGVVSKGIDIFPEVVMLHFKLKAMKPTIIC